MGFLKGTEELHQWDINATGIIRVKLLAKSIGFHRSRLSSIFLIPHGDYQDVKSSSITMNPTVGFRLLILKGFMRLTHTADFVMASGEEIDELQTSVGILTKLGVRDFLLFT